MSGALASRSRLGLALALALAASAAAAPSANYVTGKQKWLAARYAEASPPLKTHRREPYGRTADVDYMLGTSGCRIPGQREWGARVLNYALYSYALTEASRRRVMAERDRCRGTTQLAALGGEARTGLEELVAVGVAGASARGKMFSWGDESISAYPARRIRELTRAELDSRLTPIGEAARVQAGLTKLAPSGAKVRAIGRYAFVTTAGQTDAELNTLRRQLDAFIGFLEREYGMPAPSSYLTLYLVDDIADVRSVASAVHGLDVSESTLGYSFQDDLSATAVVRGTQSGTLRHELFHLLVRASFGDVPQWLDEGMAGLYEVSAPRGDRYDGLPNWRGRVLSQGWEDRPRLEAVIASPWFAFDAVSDEEYGRELPSREAAVHLATARYFALYLQDRGALTRVFKAFQARDPGAADDPGREAVRLVEREVGSLASLEAGFGAWFATVEPEQARYRPPGSEKTMPEAATAK